jgi:hypothetical protein
MPSGPKESELSVCWLSRNSVRSGFLKFVAPQMGHCDAALAARSEGDTVRELKVDLRIRPHIAADDALDSFPAAE